MEKEIILTRDECEQIAQEITAQDNRSGEVYIEIRGIPMMIEYSLDYRYRKQWNGYYCPPSYSLVEDEVYFSLGYVGPEDADSDILVRYDEDEIRYDVIDYLKAA